MRILVVGHRWSAGWSESCAEALRALGHEVTLTYYNTGVPALEQRAASLLRPLGTIPFVLRAARRYAARRAQAGPARWANLMHLAGRLRPDRIIVLRGETIPPDVYQAWRATGARLACWWLDDPFRREGAVPNRIAEAMPLIDLFAVFDRSYLTPVRQAGAVQAIHLPCAVDPVRFPPGRGGPRQWDVSFVGTFSRDRGLRLARLRHLRLGIWGPGWSDAREQLGPRWSSIYRGTAAGRQAAHVYHRSAICLNLHHQQTRDGGLNMRTFEVLAAGGFLLSDYVRGMESLLQPGEEVVCFDSDEDLSGQVDRYLRDDPARAMIAAAGHRRVLAEHTYRHRMAALLDALH